MNDLRSARSSTGYPVRNISGKTTRRAPASGRLSGACEHQLDVARRGRRRWRSPGPERRATERDSVLVGGHETTLATRRKRTSGYRRRVLRMLLTPRWVGRLALLVVVLVACAWLGLVAVGVGRESRSSGHRRRVWHR